MDEGAEGATADHDDWAEVEKATVKDAWTEWFPARLATNGGTKEIRKPTLKWKDARPHLENGAIEWLRVEIRRADIEATEVLSAFAKRNSHNDYYLRGIGLGF